MIGFMLSAIHKRGMELEIFQLKRENLEMDEAASDFLRRISWASTPRNHDFSDSIFQDRIDIIVDFS